MQPQAKEAEISTKHITSGRVRCVIFSGALTAVLAVESAASVLAADPAGPAGVPPSKTVGAHERAQAKSVPIERVEREAEPLRAPVAKEASAREPHGPDGPQLTAPGTEGQSGAEAAASTAAGIAVAAAAQNGLWPGSFSSNPNRQVGKLYFDIQPGPGVNVKHCSATAVNSENKSLVMTAGHCVFTPDPDGNGYVGGNGYWYESVRFCPGYEYGCRLGVWYARQMYTTNSWFYGSGGRYDWQDDIAVVLVSPNSQGYLVNSHGGQGITFNVSTGLYRHAFGYPAADWRFADCSYNGDDLVYCPGRDAYDGYGHIGIACTMTGGASGGAWLHNPTSSWLGTLNGVNSHKVSGETMSSPYFGSAESNLYQYSRAR